MINQEEITIMIHEPKIDYDSLNAEWRIYKGKSWKAFHRVTGQCVKDSTYQSLCVRLQMGYF